MNLFGEEEIRALPFWQPFASAMLYNKIETRSWPTNYRGLVLICSTKKKIDPATLQFATTVVDRAALQRIQDEERRQQKFPTFELHGYAIAIGRLTHCRRVSIDDNTFVTNLSGVDSKLFAHIYRDVKRIKPIPVKCGQKWFSVTDDVKQQIEYL